MKTIREQIIERVIVQLENITVDNGYNHCIGADNVYREFPIIGKGLMPAISVWELAETRRRNSYGGTVRTLTIKVEAVIEVPEGRHPAVISNELLGDLEKALIIGDTFLDELIDDIQDTVAEIIRFPLNRKPFALHTLAEDDNEIIELPLERRMAGAALEFEIRYTTEWGDPYSQ